MKLPTPTQPQPAPFQSLSPSRYNAAIVCPARALWSAVLPFHGLPAPPGALLGSSFHEIMEAANCGLLNGDAAAVRREARRLFDDEAARQLAEAHPLVRAKFAVSSRLPGYYDKREKAVMQAVKSSGSSVSPPSSSPPDAASGGVHSAAPTGANACVVEKSLASRDGLLKGKLDCFDPVSGLLTDYKSGAAPQTGGATESEARQLLLYAHLLWENDYAPREAVIVRADGQEAHLPVAQETAEAEGQAARSVLSQLNAALQQGRRVEETATPAPGHCGGCPFVAVCPAFWQAASPDWEMSAWEGGPEAAHVEGVVSAASSGALSSGALSSGELTTLELDVQRGSGLRGRAVLEQVPNAWLTCDGDGLPQQGDTVRVTGAALLPGSIANDAPSSASLRVDRIKSTAVWTL